jgi:LuxR family maltose regulon positive regulatory protein
MTTETGTLPLIRTKLYRPRTSGDLVPRPRLLERLDQRQERPLTLVVAPAGYGKTTLVATWLDTVDCPSAWLSLDEEDSDLPVFLSYFLAALQTILPDAGGETLMLLKAATLPALPVLTRTLINELEQIDKDLILVLDDYHYIRELAVHGLLTELLRHPPRALHLVLTSRSDPLLPLTRLRARSLVTEIRRQDLRFTKAETAAFLRQELGTPADDAAVTALVKRVEGWVTGLRLLILSLRHRGSGDPTPARLQGSVGYVADYLMTEVLDRQDRDIQDYLLRTAALDRFCAPLCQAVAGTDESEMDGGAFLDWLRAANLFVIPLDDERRWYRYHHLFRELLQHRLEQRLRADDIAVLHARASAWFAKEGLLEEAVHHALKGGHIPAAGRLVAQNRHEMMNREQWHRLRRLLSLIPRDAFEGDPELLVAQSWALWNQMRLTEMAHVLDRVEPLLLAVSPKSATARGLEGELDALRSVQYFLAAPCDGARALVHAQRAAQRIPPQRHSQRGFATIMLAMSYQMVGDTNSAYSVVFDALKEHEGHRTTYHTRLLITLGFIYWVQADLYRLQQTAEQQLRLGYELELPESIGIARYSLGVTHYCRNQLDAAEQNLAAVVNSTNIGNVFNFAHSTFALALTYQAQGRPSKARAVTERVVSHSLDTGNEPLLQIARAFQAELALRQGNLAEASPWAEAFDPEPFRAAHRFYVPQLTLARVFLAMDTTESRLRAAKLLARLHGFFTSIHNTRFLIDVLALQALLDDAQGDEPAALEKLERAVRLAALGGFIRPFVDPGPGLAGLLDRLRRQGVAPDYIAQILDAFPKPSARMLSSGVGRQTTTQAEASSSLIEPLTNRELEVLALLEQRLTNKEIAAQLFISPETVKRHASTIYQKLAVKNRLPAVAKAKSLGIVRLPS